MEKKNGGKNIFKERNKSDCAPWASPAPPSSDKSYYAFSVARMALPAKESKGTMMSTHNWLHFELLALADASNAALLGTSVS